MIRLLSVKDQTRQSYKITPTQGTFVSLFVEKYFIISWFEVRILSSSRCEILLFSLYLVNYVSQKN